MINPKDVWYEFELEKIMDYWKKEEYLTFNDICNKYLEQNPEKSTNSVNKIVSRLLNECLGRGILMKSSKRYKPTTPQLTVPLITLNNLKRIANSSLNEKKSFGGENIIGKYRNRTLILGFDFDKLCEEDKNLLFEAQNLLDNGFAYLLDILKRRKNKTKKEIAVVITTPLIKTYFNKKGEYVANAVKTDKSTFSS